MLDIDEYDAIDVYDWRLRPMPAAEAPIDAASWAEAQPPCWLWQWPMPRFTGYGYGWSEEYGFGSRDMEDRITFGCFLVSLFSSSLLWISARYKWRRHGFSPPATGGGVSPCAGSAERSPFSCTDRLWDLWVRTIAYVGWLFHSLFPFPFLLYWLWQPRRSALKERDNVTARLHVSCPGLGNSHSI